MIQHHVGQASAHFQLHLDRGGVARFQANHTDIIAHSRLCAADADTGSRAVTGSNVPSQFRGARIHRGRGYSGHSRLVRIGNHSGAAGNNRSGHIGADAPSGIVRIAVSIPVVCIAVAVVLIAGLHGLDSDGDAADSHFLILVARILVHLGAELDGLEIAILIQCSGSNGLAINTAGSRTAADRSAESDDIQQLQIVDAVIRRGVNRTGDGHLILDSQITLVYDLESVQIKGRTGFPNNVCSVVLVAEIQCLALEGVAACIHDVNIQITCLDLVDVGGSRVGEPRKRSAHQHDHTHGQRCDAGQQCAFGCLFVAHALVTPLQ